MSAAGHRRISGRRGALWLATAALATAALPTGASARTETIRWTYSNASLVTGFRVHIGSSSGSYGSVVQVGKPTPVSGVYSATISVGDQQTVYTVISGYNASQVSPYSNERVLTPPPPPPPPPTEPPPTEPPPTEPPPSEPPPTAVWSSSFSELAAGTDPGGWVDTQAKNSMAGDDSLFEVKALGSNKAFGTSSTLTNIHSHFVTGESVRWSAYEFTGRMMITDAKGGIGVTALSQYPQRDAYYRLRRHDGSTTSTFHMAPHPDAKVLGCASRNTGLKPAANTWYRFRFEVSAESSQTKVRAKVWADGASEPSAWQVDCTDTRSDRYVSGVPGVWSMGPGSKYWDDLAVVPLGGSPPPAEPDPGVPAAPILLE
jgi:hypothetical protein